MRSQENISFYWHWLEIPAVQEQALLEHAELFEKHVQELMPNRSIAFKPLDDKQTEILRISINNGGIPVPSDLGIDSDSFLVLVTNSQHRVAQLCQSLKPEAKYGISFPNERVCCIYEPEDKYTFWHEIYHLLGADDCYIEENDIIIDRGPTCEDADCIMQYGITKQSINIGPWVCTYNIEKIINRLNDF